MIEEENAAVVELRHYSSRWSMAFSLSKLKNPKFFCSFENVDFNVIKYILSRSYYRIDISNAEHDMIKETLFDCYALAGYSVCL